MNSFAPVGLVVVVAVAALSSGCADDGSGGGGSGGGAAQSSVSGTTAVGSGGATSGSTSTGSGSTSSGGGGAGSGGGNPGTDCGSLPVCDDFESGRLDPATWSIVTPNCSGTSTIAVDSSQAHSGSHSVKVTGAGGFCNHVFLANTSAFSSLDGPVFGRFFVRFADALGDGHTTFAAFHDSAQDKDLRMGGQSRILMWNRESDDATLPELSPTGTSMSLQPIPAAWLCVEFEVDGATGTLTTWVDGAQIPGLVVDGTPTPDVDAQWLRNPNWRPTLVDAKFGWESYAGQSMDLWFDDIALGPQRIGCGG